MGRLIDADALYEKLNKIRKEEIALYGVGNSRFCSALSTALYEIEFAPIIEERKTGKWIDGKCDQCGSHAPFYPMASTYYESNFCPNCGAKMEGEQNVTD